MTWLVRQVAATDLEGIAGLLEQLGYPTAVNALARRLGAWTASPERDLLVAAEDEVPVGLVAMTITPRLESDRSWAQVVALVVDRGHRGRGVGRDLVERVEQRAHERGCDLVVINSARSRDAAHTFYRGLGYHDRCQDHAQYVRTPDPRGLRRPPTA